MATTTITQSQAAADKSMASGGDRSYTFQTQPKPVGSSRRRPLYRANDSSSMNTGGMGQPVASSEVANIMYDRRVVRGNTYAAQVVPASGGLAEDYTSGGTGAASYPSGGARQRAAATQGGKSLKKAKIEKNVVLAAHDVDVAAVEGRRHADVQTDQYLEVLEDVIPEHDNATQTDAFNDRPPTPMFLQAKTGIDTSTQVEDGELFDFNLEVAPLLEVIIGKTIEQSFTEVLEEEELKAMRDHQEYFEQVRTAELVATQRMEAEEKRKAMENARRVKQEEERIAREKQVRNKISSVQLARGYLTGVFDVVFDKLYEDGTFFDPSVKEVEDDFLPLLTAMVTKKVTQKEISREVMRKIIREAIIKASEAKQKSVASAPIESEPSSSAGGEGADDEDSSLSISNYRAARRIEDARKLASTIPTLLLEESTNFVSTEDVSAVRAELADEAQSVADALTAQKKEEAATAIAALEEKATETDEAAKAAAKAAEECQSEMMAALTSSSEALPGEGGEAQSSDIAALELKFNELKADADEKLSLSAEARAAFEKAKDDLNTISDELPMPISDEATLKTLFSKGVCTEKDAKDVLAILELGSASYTQFSPPITA